MLASRLAPLFPNWWNVVGKIHDVLCRGARVNFEGRAGHVLISRERRPSLLVEYGRSGMSGAVRQNQLSTLASCRCPYRLIAATFPSLDDVSRPVLSRPFKPSAILSAF
jgi:hypothetical protein